MVVSEMNKQIKIERMKEKPNFKKMAGIHILVLVFTGFLTISAFFVSIEEKIKLIDILICNITPQILVMPVSCVYAYFKEKETNN